METNKKLYHVSKMPNIEEIEPRISKHKIPYVYATTNLPFAILFGSSNSHGNLDGKFGVEPGGIVSFYEAFPNSFKERFENQTCYVYEVDPTTFLVGKTEFRNEVVSPVPVKVISCREIKDLYQYFQKLIKENRFKLIEFQHNQEYQEMIDSHIKETIQYFGILNNKNGEGYVFCKKHFPHLFEDSLTNKKTQA